MSQSSKFEQTLSEIDALSFEEQESLIQIVQRRLAERRRAEIAANIAQAKTEYATGKVVRGSVEQVMTELRK
ncbi:hypothetical protein ACQ4M3_32675 [Leptolyngbya sp. AN03gr2]|uniref:hypothetical protein n=1 Tax=unclassified Leptolyngbya TaxID=2650499 RepID=UPI003D315E39